MPQLAIICIFSLTSILAYIFSITAPDFAPQAIALITIVSIICLKQKQLLIYFIAIIINIIVFTTNGLNSPVFFLIYFLLFIIAFQNPPTTTLSYSLVLILFLSQSLNSLYSLLPLISLLFISPLVWFIGRQYLENFKLNNSIERDETDVLLWLSLKFKTGICQIIDTSSELLSQPQLSHTQKEQIHKIKDSAKSLLNSSQKLEEEIDSQTDEK